jgi:hypothetical protein
MPNLDENGQGFMSPDARCPPAMSTNPIPIASEQNCTGYQQYSEGLPGEELGETARVWHMYGDEAREIDKETIDEYKESIDILLVFVRGPSYYGTMYVSHSCSSMLFHRRVYFLPL